MNEPIQNASDDAIATVLGRTPSGVFILSAGDGNGNVTGMLASWVQQAAFEPPMVTVAVNRKRYLHEWLDRSPQIVLNLVGERQASFIKHFARGFEPGEPAFEGLETTRSASGLPVLAEALGYLEGTISGEAEAGDHIVYFVEITAAGAGEELATKQPMVHIRKNGFRY